MHAAYTENSNLACSALPSHNQEPSGHSWGAGPCTFTHPPTHPRVGENFLPNTQHPREGGGGGCRCSSATHCLLPEVSRASPRTTHKQQDTTGLVLEQYGTQCSRSVRCSHTTARLTYLAMR